MLLLFIVIAVLSIAVVILGAAFENPAITLFGVFTGLASVLMVCLSLEGVL